MKRRRSGAVETPRVALQHPIHCFCCRRDPGQDRYHRQGRFKVCILDDAPSDAVSAQIIAWKRDRLAVEYCYPGGTTDAGPIRPEDWPEIKRFDSKASTITPTPT